LEAEMAEIPADQSSDVIGPNEEPPKLGAESAGYLVVAPAVPPTLRFHLLGTVFAALTVRVLTIKLA
jgi:hypothetical protein